MNNYWSMCVGGAIALSVSGVAMAAPPAWCKEAPTESRDLRGLSSKDIKEVLRTFVSAACAPSREAESQRAEIEKGRAAWGKRLGMVEADWADAVAYTQTNDDYSIAATVSTKTLATATPIDQYAIIMKANETSSNIDAMYATDMFDGNLSEVGRFAFLTAWCWDRRHERAAREEGALTGLEVPYAVCQADFQRFDLARFLTEVRADRAHDGAIKMKLRVAAYDMAKQLKDHADAVQKMLQADDGNKQLFEVAAAARTAWSSSVGKDTKLLELVLTMDSATLAKSRKQLEGCAEATQAAVAEAVSTIPAKAFAGMRDQPDEASPVAFATQAGPVLGQSPAVVLAATAHLLCAPEAELSKFFEQVLDTSPASRGPRTAALSKLRTATIAYDGLKAKLSHPEPRPYGAHYPSGAILVRSLGGVVTSFKRDGEMLAVSLEKTTVKQDQCLKSHSTGRVSRIRDNGSVEYERVCDKSGTMVRDTTWKGMSVLPRYAPLLKPGVRASVLGNDVIAVWPSKAAKVPSVVLGGAVK